MKKRILMLTLRGMFLAVSLVVTSHAESVQAAKPQKSTVMPVRAEAKKIESVTITPARTSVGANRMSVDERRLSAERELQQQKKEAQAQAQARQVADYEAALKAAVRPNIEQAPVVVVPASNTKDYDEALKHAITMKVW
jgi:hypothetical protein